MMAMKAAVHIASTRSRSGCASDCEWMRNNSRVFGPFSRCRPLKGLQPRTAAACTLGRPALCSGALSQHNGHGDPSIRRSQLPARLQRRSAHCNGHSCRGELPQAAGIGPAEPSQTIAHGLHPPAAPSNRTAMRTPDAASSKAPFPPTHSPPHWGGVRLAAGCRGHEC